MTLVLVVVPTYNEKGNVGVVVEKLSQVRASMETDLQVLFVDDGSPDGTQAELESLMKVNSFVHILERGAKKGLGTAYLDGFRHGRATLNPDIFVQMDSDLQHPPERVPLLVDAILEQHADVALGSRHIRGGSVRGLNRRRRVVSWGANWLARNILGLKVRDATTGFRGLSRRAVDTLLQVRLYSLGFIYQVESLFAFKQNGLSMVEVPLVFELREKGASKMSEREVGEFFSSVLRMRFRDYRVEKQ